MSSQYKSMTNFHAKRIATEIVRSNGKPVSDTPKAELEAITQWLMTNFPDDLLAIAIVLRTMDESLINLYHHHHKPSGRSPDL